jgi:hypothetical protein
MIEWIKKHLDPPGNERKNWRSLFSFIGCVFGIVKDDAVKAHNAFFPYLCDADKLRQHGNSLMIPELPFDTEKNYRDRVATASFYLMRAGERAYIHEQLQSHFGERYIISDEFLKVYLKVTELNTEERVWAFSFLDSILDPNISFSLAELFNFKEEINSKETPAIAVKPAVAEGFFGQIKHNGRIARDGHTSRTVEKTVFRHDGTQMRNGTAQHLLYHWVNSNNFLAAPFRHSSGAQDRLSFNCRTIMVDTLSSTGETFSAGIRYHRYHNGFYKHNGKIKHNGNMLIPLE